ncbi:imidazole glycerol phosphate synthase subunit HisH [Pyrobaculum neutrophilum]|uniref:Imidazole glycerol phosphate synthase subunit HisH n=1 Tax=Pyrobaculum neutrophilum (strain DSM 2338 / JCM 9278 / NBRC 100436 / V24Sta) TaxID=444157 RepID=B1YAM6_PYRNV|nr:imidazole glycerol phosphate synthase subunit HisH [Pyrobaculum neutrophilum]ACB39105.1 imidazole glycerol phosphate synthase, glutamine amidotransferase subunit [Pyrobaculum neutrophilum V24Sta]
MQVGVVDYTVGNVGSVLNALRRAGAEPRVVKSVEEAGGVDALVLPGVGTYEVAYKLVHEFRQAVLEKPTLAICLGMQLLFESSEEGGGRGLAVFRGAVRRIEARKVPHIGWSYTKAARPQPFVEDGYYYYMHSYGVPWDENDESHVAYVELGRRYVAAVLRGGILGLQFHPERSGRSGIELIRRFLKEARR